MKFSANLGFLWNDRPCPMPFTPRMRRGSMLSNATGRMMSVPVRFRRPWRIRACECLA